ncbi:Phosphatidylinositol 4-phosphate 3-kinase C2 domain-containing subunit alpha [Homalodisca vitripennis]|nr:Phosphatidylinositol 4-phosphate 3-kinase C2 domain-containing subunit alpha [Homalodisca vitripennis]
MRQLYHGTRPVGHPVLSKPTPPSRSLYNRVIFVTIIGVRHGAGPRGMLTQTVSSLDSRHLPDSRATLPRNSTCGSPCAVQTYATLTLSLQQSHLCHDNVCLLVTVSYVTVSSKLSSEVLDTVLVHVECLHRLSAAWTHDTYLIAGQLYHGTRPVGHPVLSKPTPPSRSLYNRVIFDCWLNFEGTSVCELPRECRLVLVVYGRSVTPATEGGEGGEVTQVELGWSAVQFFNYEGVLVQGTSLLSVWPPGADKRLGPAPASGTQPHGDTHPVLGEYLSKRDDIHALPNLQCAKSTKHLRVILDDHISWANHIDQLRSKLSSSLSLDFGYSLTSGSQD